METNQAPTVKGVNATKGVGVAKTLWSWIWPIAVGIIIAKLLLRFVFGFAMVPSGSMYPTIPVNPPTVPQPSYIMVDHLATELGAPYRGEVVLFPWPDDPKEIFVKRIIGMPGDTVYIHSGHVYINGKVLNEPYLNKVYGFMDPNERYGPYHVPAGHYFMMGDNRGISDDSRYWKHPYVARSAIIGRADFAVWPFNKIHRIQQ